MSYIKKILAGVLILAMMLGLVVAGEASSPTDVPTSANPNYDPATGNDTETAQNGVQVVFHINSDGTSTITSVQQSQGTTGTSVNAYGGYDENGNYVPAAQVGDGKHGVLNSKLGQKITTFAVNNGDNQVTINANAFKGSKVKTVKINGKKVKIKKNAFKGTKQKTVKIYVKKAKKATDVSVAKGAFNGLSSKSKIYVSKKNMSKKEYNKLVKKLRKAGFKGKVVRN